MDRDAFAQQFITGLAGRGATKEDIAKILPQALSDFDAKQQPKMTSQQALNKQVPIQPNQPVNPLMQAAGKTQEFLGKSPLLPILGAGMARAAVPIPIVSSAVGAMAGERAKQSLNEGGGMAALKMLIPSLEKSPQVQGDIAKIGAFAGGAELATIGAGKALGVGKDVVKGAIGSKSISPLKISSYLRDQAVNKAGELTTQALIDAGDKLVKDNPFGKEAWDILRPTISAKMPAADLLSKMQNTFSGAYNASGGVKSGGEAKLMNYLYQSGKGIMKDQAPEVAKYTSGMHQILQAPKNLQKITWLMAKLGLAKGAF